MGFVSASMNGNKAFFPGTSSKLISKCLIQDHMLSHYKKVLSAKAAVDCSAPRSLITSIKYCDQKRKEKNLQNLASYEREIPSAHSSRRNSSAWRPSSANNPKNNEKSSGFEEFYPNQESTQSFSPRYKCYHSKQKFNQSKTCPMRSSSQTDVDYSSELSYGSSFPRRNNSASSYSSSESKNTYRSFQDPKQKTYSGDLLEKHSNHFTEHQPFAPRTLKKDSHSFLSQYRYYAAPRRKKVKERTTRMVDHDTQTDQISMTSDADIKDKTELLESDWSKKEAAYKEGLTLDDKSGLNKYLGPSSTRMQQSAEYDLMSSPLRLSISDRVTSPVMRKVKAEEEEIQYLEFIANLTNEIITMGLYSDRVLERVFHRHVEQNKHRLDEGKMHHLIDVLREDLGISASVIKTRETRGFSKKTAHLDFGLEEDHSLSLQTEETNVSSSPRLYAKESFSTKLPEGNSDQFNNQEPEILQEEFQREEDVTLTLEKNTAQDEIDVDASGNLKDVEVLEQSLAESLFISSKNESLEISLEPC
ncbi:spermatogenesis-associated protein 7 [Polypterus senegalus]|uniref:spermatogenesis-associated protein 7 n=1 Tax=Polypterus senegalus TaxID=55291 RepID=UPI00196463FB|nr:spermatogenesis-associated protein 7 [Polypterus senegalus]